MSSAPTESILLEPGSFARREYAGTVPALPGGTAVLAVTNIATSPIALTISAAPVVAAAPSEKPAARKEGTESPSRSSGFDPADFFKRHFSAYEPIYFIAGPDSPNGKFQYSFKYKLFETGTNAGPTRTLLGNTYFAFTQTSLWDLSKASSPFQDSSYQPEAFYYEPGLLRNPPEWFGLGYQTGFRHESNGRDGPASRSLNQVYLEPILRFGPETKFHATLYPRAWFYVGGLEDNPDLPFFRGYCGLRATAGWPDSLQVRSTLRVGDTGERASLMVDVSYPIWRKGFGMPWYLYFQYFLGYGESLLNYKERVSTFRLGLAIYR